MLAQSSSCWDGGIVVNRAAFQAVDAGLICGHCSAAIFLGKLYCHPKLQSFITFFSVYHVVMSMDAWNEHATLLFGWS